MKLKLIVNSVSFYFMAREWRSGSAALRSTSYPLAVERGLKLDSRNEEGGLNK